MRDTEALMIYKVTLKYETLPVLILNVQAENMMCSRIAARTEARRRGWDEKPKSVKSVILKGANL